MSAVPQYHESGSAWPADVMDGSVRLGQSTETQLVELYFAVWALLIPVTSLIVVPGVQGTVPAYLMALLSPIFCLNRKYLATLVAMAGAWLLFVAISQAGLLWSGTREHLALTLVEPSDPTPVFRSTLLTQTLYLLACALTFLFFKNHYRESMMRYVFWGAWFVVLYGMWDWGLQTLTGVSGDFLSNRTFAEAGGQTRDASWAQYYNVGPFRILRFKSTATEPSRYATLAVAYLALAIAYRRRLLSLLLLMTLFLTVSLTGLIGLLVMFTMFCILRPSSLPKGTAAIAALAMVVGGVFCWIMFPGVIDEMLWARLSGEHRSTQIRLARLTEPLPVFWHLPIVNQWFGVGAGTCFLTGSMRALLNWGIIGLLLSAALFVIPVCRLRRSSEAIGLVTAVAVLGFLYTFISVGVFLPLTWMLLGMAHGRMSEIATDNEGTPMGSESYSLGNSA